MLSTQPALSPALAEACFSPSKRRQEALSTAATPDKRVRTSSPLHSAHPSPPRRPSHQEQADSSASSPATTPTSPAVKELAHEYMGAEADDLVLLIGTCFSCPFIISPVPALRGLVCTKLTSSNVSSAASMLTKLIAHNDQVPLSTCVSCHSPGSCGWLVLTTRVPPSFPNPNIETTSLASTRALRQASLSSSICAESCATRTSRCVLKQLVRWETCVLGPRLTPFPLQRRPRSPEISPPHPPPLPRHLLRPLSELHSVLPDRPSVPHLLGLCGQ